MSYRKIADEIDVSPPTVLSRVQKLEKDKIIKSYRAMIDHEKLGYDLTAIIEVTAVKGKITEVEKHISKFTLKSWIVHCVITIYSTAAYHLS
jgi:DNA-binding Lrp family transcriptional regulator